MPPKELQEHYRITNDIRAMTYLNEKYGGLEDAILNAQKELPKDTAQFRIMKKDFERKAKNAYDGILGMLGLSAILMVGSLAYSFYKNRPK